MKIRQLTIKEMDAVYHAHLIYDFPASEVKSMDMIQRGYACGKYFAYGLFVEDTSKQQKDSVQIVLKQQEEFNMDNLAAYAFFIRSESCRYILLDYLAVVRGRRDGGFGSVFLQQLQSMCVKENMKLILEVENPAYAPDEDIRAYREKRIRFYIKNQILVSNVSCNFYDNEYLILYSRQDEEKNSCPSWAEIDAVYRDFFGDKFIDQHVKFH